MTWIMNPLTHSSSVLEHQLAICTHSSHSERAALLCMKRCANNNQISPARVHRGCGYGGSILMVPAGRHREQNALGHLQAYANVRLHYLMMGRSGAPDRNPLDSGSATISGVTTLDGSNARCVKSQSDHHAFSLGLGGGNALCPTSFKRGVEIGRRNLDDGRTTRLSVD